MQLPSPSGAWTLLRPFQYGPVVVTFYSLEIFIVQILIMSWYWLLILKVDREEWAVVSITVLLRWRFFKFLSFTYIRFSSLKLCSFSSRFLFCLKMSRENPRFHSQDDRGDHKPLQIHLLSIQHWIQGKDAGRWRTREPRQGWLMRTSGEPWIAPGQSLSEQF